MIERQNIINVKKACEANASNKFLGMSKEVLKYGKIKLEEKTPPGVFGPVWT